METTPTQAIIDGAVNRAEEPSSRPPIPDDPLAAQAVLPWYQQRLADTYQRYQRARQEWEQASGELAIVRDAINGAFEREPTHAVGSNGPWPIDLESKPVNLAARYDLTAKRREALS